jgi:O-antigen/teichoic acid export membrane protein
MTHMVAGAKELTRGLFGRGAAGDAGAAGGRHIVSNIAAQLAARAITMALSIVTVSLLARTLEPAGYGIWNGASSYVGLFAVLTDLGFSIAATQRMAAEPEREAEWLGALVIVRLAMSLAVCVLCAACIPLLLGDTHHAQLVALIMTFSILWTGTTAVMTVFQTRLRGGLVLSFTVLQGLLWLLAVAMLSVANASVVAFAVANTTVIATACALQVGFTWRYADIAWRASLRLWRPLVRRAIPMGLASVFITIYFQVDSVLLLEIAGASEAGIYGAASGFLGPLTFLPAAIMSSFFPVLSAVLRSDPVRARRLVQVCADLMGVVGLPILAGAIALSGPLVHLIFGPSFARAAGLLPILMIAFVSIGYGSLAGFLAPLLNLQWRLALYSGIGAAANVVLNLILIPSRGAYGSAWATVATELLTMTLMLTTSFRALKMIPSPWKFLRTIALAAAMTGVMILTRRFGLIPAGVIGLLVYAGGLFALRIVRPHELRALRSTA